MWSWPIGSSYWSEVLSRSYQHRIDLAGHRSRDTGKLINKKTTALPYKWSLHRLPEFKNEQHHARFTLGIPNDLRSLFGRGGQWPEHPVSRQSPASRLAGSLHLRGARLGCPAVRFCTAHRLQGLLRQGDVHRGLPADDTTVSNGDNGVMGLKTKHHFSCDPLPFPRNGCRLSAGNFELQHPHCCPQMECPNGVSD